jgi:signal transduction histidine kinase
MPFEQPPTTGEPPSPPDHPRGPQPSCRPTGPPWGRRDGPYGPADQPPWWPNDLSWPPDDQTWKRHRSRLFRRILLALILFGFFICLLGWGVATLLDIDRWRSGPPAHFGIILLVLITAVVTALIKMKHFRRALVSGVDLMEGVDRVAAGDYRVRVVPRGAGELRQLAESFNVMVERLADNDEQRRRLFADIAHELRTPLAVIQGTIEGVIDGVYPGDAAHMEPLLAEVAVITRLLDDLQLLAHAEAGELRLHREPVELRPLIAELAAAHRPQAGQAGIELHEEIEELPEIEIDPIRIRQVLENLMANALRYTPSGGAVTIAARREPGTVVIEVRDTGAGMTPDQRAGMFERFVKSADSGGSGLGLAIARSLVEAHGGEIAAEAAPDQGTIVRFTLPLANEG